MKKTLTELATSFLTDTARFAATGFKTTPDDIFEQRLNVCKSCEHYDEKSFAGTGRCGECGCSIQAKLRIGSSSCPLNKWTAI
jgi:predicted Zn-ribbon and HTH transcriptional regulator